MQPQSFIDFLAAYGEANPPSMIYQDGEDFAEWQERFRAAVESLRGPAPDRVEPRAEIVETAEADGHTRHLLSIPVSDLTTLPAYLLIPHGIEGGEKRPSLLVSHGHHHHGMDSICGVLEQDTEHAQQMADALHAVQAGYVVLAPAWWGWAGRDGHVEGIGGRGDKCNVIQMAAAMYGMNVLDLHIQDAQAAVDVLAARPEVDPERIGCIGNSYGGRTTMWFTVFDERIKVSIPAGCMNTFRERSLKLSSCGIQYLPGLLRYGDVPEVFALIAPRPMQLHVGAKDSLVTPADRDHMASVVRNAYRQLGAEDSFELAMHPEGHMLVWDLADAFLRKHL